MVHSPAAELSSVGSFALSPPFQLLGRSTDGCKQASATSELGGHGHGLTKLDQTMPSSQQKDLSTQTRKQQR